LLVYASLLFTDEVQIRRIIDPQDTCDSLATFVTGKEGEPRITLGSDPSLHPTVEVPQNITVTPANAAPSPLAPSIKSTSSSRVLPQKFGTGHNHHNSEARWESGKREEGEGEHSWRCRCRRI
jgi:hypothetical protein